MTHVIVRYFWALLIGWWAAIFWFLIGYFLIAIVVTRETGYWVWNRLAFVFSLNTELEPRNRIFYNKIVTYIWFYLTGWWIGPIVIVLAILIGIFIVPFRLSEKMVHEIDAAIIAS